MRWLVLAMLIGCGGVECEQLALVQTPNLHYEITCIHECGMVLSVGYWYPGPTCEWERRECEKFCAGQKQK